LSQKLPANRDSIVGPTFVAVFVEVVFILVSDKVELENLFQQCFVRLGEHTSPRKNLAKIQKYHPI